MDLNKLILQTLKPIDIPVYYIARKEVNPPLILFNVTGETGIEFSDDEEKVIRYRITINLFSKNNFMEQKRQIIKLMTQAGFIRNDVQVCDYIEELDVYNLPILFTFYENVEG